MVALDLRRGPAALLALALVGLGVVLVLGTPADCDGRWPDAVISLRSSSAWLVIPCILAAGVWRGGSARRRHLSDVIGASSRPGWQRAAVEGGSIGLVGAATYLLLLTTVTATGGCTSALPTASSAGVAVAGVLAIQAAAFAGLALGRLATGPMAAPLALFAGLSVTSVLGGWSGEGSEAMLLLPSLDDGVSPQQLSVRTSMGQTLWFAGLAVSGWLCASRWPARVKIASLAPAVGGLAGWAALSLA
jgi:hypothetical protein